MIKQKILAVLTSLCIGVLPLAAGMAAAPVAAEDTTEPVRILAMGDSITDGYINGDNGYRKYFCYEMQQKGFTNFDMVGPKNNWSDSVSYTTSDGVTFQYDPAHAGYSGYAIEKIGSRQGLYETIFDTTYYNNNVTGNMIEAYDPDIVLLQIGTNDLLDNQNAGITDRLEKLVLQYNPKWSGAGETKHPISVAPELLEYFDLTYHEEYELDVSFTRTSWNGRMKACRGIGASLTPEEIAAWENEHLQLLERIAPETFLVRHYAAIAELRKK